MFQTPSITPQSRGKKQQSSLVFISVALFTLGVLLVLFTGCGSQATTKSSPPPQPQPQPKHVQLKLDIVINQPGMQKDWPAYSPSNLVVPANSLVTVTIRDYDLGDTAMPKDSPFTKIQGTIDGTASADGSNYSSLAPDKIAHTFTIPQLNVNIPLPGDGLKGKDFDTVTFTFRTGKAGTYTFQCFDPCGTGSSGWEGPMVTKGYMIGTLTVQ